MAFRKFDTPSQGILAITPHDTNPLAVPSVVTVVVAGNLSVITPNGQTVTITSAPVGYTTPFLVNIVRATGTTATAIGL